MKTLKELNERAWYRFLKVLYIALYVLYVGALIFGVYELGREYHPERLPATFSKAITDPDFKVLDTEKKREVLSEVNHDFARLFPAVQEKVIGRADSFKVVEANKAGYSDSEIINYLASSKFSDKPLTGPWDEYKPKQTPPTAQTYSNLPPGWRFVYNYSAYYSWKIKDIFYYSTIFIIGFILIMESVRRSFYYIVLGKAFPKKEALS